MMPNPPEPDEGTEVALPATVTWGAPPGEARPLEAAQPLAQTREIDLVRPARGNGQHPGPPRSPGPRARAAVRPDAREHLGLVRRPQGARPGLADHGARHGHRADRAVRLRQVNVPADPEPDARDDQGRRAGRRGAARRQRHLRPGAAADRRPAADRDGVPEAEPVPGHVDLRQRGQRPEAVGDQGGATRTTWWSPACAGPGCGTRCSAGCAHRAAACPAASSNASASPGRWRSPRTCC